MDMMTILITMNTGLFVTVLSAFVVCILATFLVFHERYEDGFWGRLALVGLIFSGIAFVVDGLTGHIEDVLPATALDSLAFAVFLIRHTYRFVRWTRTGAHSWDKGEA